MKDFPAIDQMILKEEVKGFSNSLKIIRTNIQRLYGLIWCQCTSGLQGTIRTCEDFIKKREKFDKNWFLKNIKERLSGLYKNQNEKMAIRDNNNSLLDRFESNKEVLFLLAGKEMICSEKVLNKKIKYATEEEIDETVEKFLVVCLLSAANNKKYCDMKIRLKERENDGYDEYSTTTQET